MNKIEMMVLIYSAFFSVSFTWSQPASPASVAFLFIIEFYVVIVFIYLFVFTLKQHPMKRSINLRQP